MSNDSGAERGMLVLGAVPLAIAAIWLVALRSPRPVAAHAAARGLATEHSAVLPAEAPPGGFLGLIVAGQEADLGAELPAKVVRVFARPGAPVRAGDPLIQLSAVSTVGAQRMAAAQEEQQRSVEQATELAREAAVDKSERMQHARDAYPEQELRAALADALRADAELARVRATRKLQRASWHRELARAGTQLIRAPFAGILAASFVDAGDFVPAGAILARVVDATRGVRFAAPARELARLEVGSSVRVGTYDGALTGEATIMEAVTELDAAIGLGFARAELRADQFGVANLPLGTRVEVRPLDRPFASTGARPR